MKKLGWNRSVVIGWIGEYWPELLCWPATTENHECLFYGPLFAFVKAQIDFVWKKIKDKKIQIE